MAHAEAMLENGEVVDALSSDELHTLIDACNNLGMHGPGISAAAARLVRGSLSARLLRPHAHGASSSRAVPARCDFMVKTRTGHVLPWCSSAPPSSPLDLLAGPAGAHHNGREGAARQPHHCVMTPSPRRHARCHCAAGCSCAATKRSV
jgi:hypothetical protein